MANSTLSTSSSTFEQDQQLFADTILKLQIHAALAKEHLQNQQSPLPLLAKSCALLDNLPSNTPANARSCHAQSFNPSNPSPTDTPQRWTPAQEQLISSLKIDAWRAFSDACIQAQDLIQAEASLQRLASLQDAAAGPWSFGSRSKSKASKLISRHSYTTHDALSSKESPSSTPPPKTTASEPSNPATVPPTFSATLEQTQAARDMIHTWEKLRQVYSDMGKSDMANNLLKRVQKMNERLSNSS